MSDDKSSLFSEWNYMSEAEKTAALKAWNEEQKRKDPYVPPLGKPINWDETLVAVAFLASLSFAVFDSSRRVWAILACVCCLAWRLGRLNDRVQKLEEVSNTSERKDQ